MVNILLIEPDYRSKFPPLGLMRISNYHKSRGDAVTFARGRVEALRDARWHRIYVSSLFTWELPRTVKTAKYYLNSTSDPANVFVGGIAATLMPEYIEKRVPCTVIRGSIDRKGKLGPGIPSLEAFIPDYSILDSANYEYKPEDAYFIRITKGCIRKCKFCAVPLLEPRFGRIKNWRQHLHEARERYGERRHLVVLDNNILATKGIHGTIQSIRREGFEKGAKLNGRKRTVDFNQGIDARLITPGIAKALSALCLSPVRLAFDFDSIEPRYRRAVRRLADVGFEAFTTYVMFNFKDTPQSLYHRMSVNLELSEKLKIRVTGFPMRYVPVDGVTRRHVGPHWHWRYLRGIQCVLLATHGMVSPNPEFFEAAFGKDVEEFLEILSMPDHYIIHRKKHKDNGAAGWRGRFRRLSDGSKMELFDILAKLNRSRTKKAGLRSAPKRFRGLLEHYCPKGKVPHG